MTDDCTAPTSDDVQQHFGSRKAYNAYRSKMAACRRSSIEEGLKRHGTGRGVLVKLATELGVHPSTITRDVQIILNRDRKPCPTCGTLVSPIGSGRSEPIGGFGFGN